MNKLRSAIASGIFSACLLFGGCDINSTNISKKDDSTNKEYHLENFKNVSGDNNYEKPSSIVKYDGINSRNSFFNGVGKLEGKLLFYEAPTLNYETKQFLKRPAIYSALDITNPEKIFEFSDDYLDEFNSDQYVLEDGALRITGLLSSLVPSSDDSILFISNVSNKMFKIYKSETTFVAEEFLVDDELYGINSMIFGEDGKMYAVQEQLESSGGNILRNRRVISIDLSNSLIKEEFILPKDISTDILFGIKENTYLDLGNKLDLVRNNAVGKNLNGFDFFVSDLISGSIYSHSLDRTEANEFASGLIFPSSLAVDFEGKVLTIEGPRLSTNEDNQPRNIQMDEPPRIVQLDSQNGNINLYSFQGGIDKYDTEWYKLLEGGRIVPINLYMDSVLIEDDFNWDFYYTNSLTGEVGLVSADKTQE